MFRSKSALSPGGAQVRDLPLHGSNSQRVCRRTARPAVSSSVGVNELGLKALGTGRRQPMTLGRHHELRGDELRSELDGAKILIRLIEKLHPKKVRKFVDRIEPVDLEWQSPC